MGLVLRFHIQPAVVAVCACANASHAFRHPVRGGTKVTFINASVIRSNGEHADYSTGKKRGEPDYAMSRSELCDFLECPEKWVEGTKKETNASMEWGSLIDTLILTPDRLNARYVVAPSHYSETKMKCPKCETLTDAKTCRDCKCERVPVAVRKPWDWGAGECKKYRERFPGLQVIKHETSELAIRARSRLFKDPEIRELIEQSEKQVMCRATYRDDVTAIEVPICILIDLLPPADHQKLGRSVIDLKTVSNAHPRMWRRTVFDCNWHVQAALYLDVYSAARPMERDTFRHVIQENEPPFLTAKRYMTGDFIAEGRSTYRTALAHYCKCLAEGKWTGYDEYQRDAYDGWGVTQLEAWMVGAKTDWPVERIVECPA